MVGSVAGTDTIYFQGQLVEVVTRFGPGTETYKRVLMELFGTKALLTRGDIQERVQSELSQSLTRRDYQYIATHLCRFENKMYTLRVRDTH